MSKLVFQVAYVPVLLLVGCGGGGGNSDVAGSAPSSGSPSPSPTSSPTAAPTGTTLLNFAGPQQFDTLEPNLYYERAPSGAVSLTTTSYSFSPTNDFAFTADSPSSTLRYFFNGSTVPPNNTSSSFYVAAFPPSSRFSSGISAGYAAYRFADGATYTLTRLIPGSSSSAIALNYVGIGSAEASIVDGANGNTKFDYRAFGYGFPAEQSAVPTIGSGQYNGIIVGRAISVVGSAVYTISGSINIATEFAGKTYTGSITLTGTDDRSGQVIGLGSFPITPSAPYPTPLNNLSAYIDTNRGELRAKLAGTTAEELEGSFTLSIPDPRAAGAMLRIVAAVAARR